MLSRGTAAGRLPRSGGGGAAPSARTLRARRRRRRRSSGVVPHMPIKGHGIGCPGYPRESVSSGSGAQVRRTLPVRLHLRALLARRIDAPPPQQQAASRGTPCILPGGIDAAGYLRDAALAGAIIAAAGGGRGFF